MPPTRGVLVVTHDRELQHEVRFAFPEDFEVVVVDDARRARAELGAWTPAVLIVDLLTGSAGGFALGSDMAQDRTLTRVPMLMLIERPQDEWLARQGGADAVRTKPIDTAELVETALELVGANAK